MSKKLPKKSTLLLSVLISYITLYAPLSQAENKQKANMGNKEEIIMHKESIKAEVLNTSAQWVTAFNAGNIKYCSESYTENAVMDARPMGKYQGRQAIFDFWHGFVNSTNAKDLTYTDIKVKVINETSAILSANWSMNVGRGFITKELWVKKEGVWSLSEDDFTVEEQF